MALDPDKKLTEQPIDWNVMASHQRPKTIAEALDPIKRNMAYQLMRQKENNEPIVGTGPEFLPPMCRACYDTGRVRIVKQDSGAFLGYGECKGTNGLGCAWKAEHRRRQVERLNNRWPMQEWEKDLARMEWDDHRPGAPNAARSRQAQQAYIEQMPSARTFFITGPAGVGKSRLLSEIALAARERGLSSIYRTIESLRRIMQDFPRDGEDESERAYKRRRLEVAWNDLTAADVVCIDEVDHAQGAMIYETLLELMNARIAAGKSTAIAGNEDILKLGGPVISRLRARGNMFLLLKEDEDARSYLGHGAQS